MVFRVSRERRDGRFLEWKVGIFAAGGVLGLAGIYLDEAWMRLGAILVLAGGMLLRFLPGQTPPEDDEDDGDAGAEDGHAGGDDPARR